MKPRDVRYELFCLLLPRSSSAAKVTLEMEACRCGGCEGCWRFTGEHDDDGRGLVTGPLGRRRTRAEVALWTPSTVLWPKVWNSCTGGATGPDTPTAAAPPTSNPGRVPTPST